MLRFLYRFSLRLHPPAFRQRFGDEMLSLFDRAQGKLDSFRLLMDSLISLARQWTLRQEFWYEGCLSPIPPPAHGTPSFRTLDPFRPRASAVIHGVMLSVFIFCVTCFAVKYSWIHVLNIQIPAVQFESPQSIHSDSEASAFLLETAAPTSWGNAAPVDESVPMPTSAAPQKARLTMIADHSLVLQPSAVARSEPQQIPGASPEAASQNTPSTSMQAVSDDAKLDAAERRLLLDAVIRSLKEHYFDPEVAQKIADALLLHESSGNDDGARNGEVFANLLTEQMKDAGHDRHLVMVYSHDRLPDRPLEPTPEVVARYRKDLEQDNCTFKKVEILPNNIGYLKLDAFPDLSICQSTAKAAMAAVNHVDAIIFDLRDNRGGYGNMVALIASYLFDHPEYIYDPRVSPTRQSWTLSPVPGNRLADKPVYVLTSASTVSAAEQFCYSLKMLRRARFVGETTRGSAHAGVWHRINDHFGMGIPESKAVNPYSNTDWEGTGVQPDVKVKAADALETARKLAESELQKKKKGIRDPN
jgi:hypothetical protein